MITGEVCTKIEFNTEDENRIKAAYNVLEEINNAFGDVGGFTTTEQEILENAMNLLEQILDGKCF